MKQPACFRRCLSIRKQIPIAGLPVIHVASWAKPYAAEELRPGRIAPALRLRRNAAQNPGHSSRPAGFCQGFHPSLVIFTK